MLCPQKRKWMEAFHVISSGSATAPHPKQRCKSLSADLVYAFVLKHTPALARQVEVQRAFTGRQGSKEQNS